MSGSKRKKKKERKEKEENKRKRKKERERREGIKKIGIKVERKEGRKGGRSVFRLKLLCR